MRTPFQACADCVHERQWAELVDLVERNPTVVHEQDESGRTLLMYCAGAEGAAPIIRKLVELGADPNHRAFDNSTALAAAIVGGTRYGLTTLNELKTLLELGADPEAIADGGMPALHWAIAQHRQEHAKLLIAHGVDLTRMTEDTPPESAEDIARRIGSRELLILFARST